MTGKELAEVTGGKILCGDPERSLSGCYIGDLLSLAMSRVQSDNVWITIQSNINIVAVASLTDAGCIVICDGFSPDEDALEKAKDEDILIITSEKSAYDIAKLI
ncbi:MAG: hypothetical protein J6N52_12965 [Clostridia bacterium]|nr:hypothetical protein [Clostridia bacterium]